MKHGVERTMSEDDLIAAFNQPTEQSDASTIEDVISLKARSHQLDA